MPSPQPSLTSSSLLFQNPRRPKPPRSPCPRPPATAAPPKPLRISSTWSSSASLSISPTSAVHKSYVTNSSSSNHHQHHLHHHHYHHHHHHHHLHGQHPTLTMLPEPWTQDPRSGAASQKGLRRRMNEDRVFALPAHGIYGVCDGHGTESMSSTLVRNASAVVAAVNDSGIPPPPMPAHQVAELLPKLLRSNGMNFEQAFAVLDRQICAALPPCSFIGTTVTVAHVERGRYVSVAHVGDSRALLISADGGTHYLTDDHLPTRPDEDTRIERAGGHVFRGRVNGVLAVSRSIGDRALKAVVPPTPDVVHRPLHPADQLLVLASDGLWDLCSAQQVVDIIKATPLQPGATAVPKDLKAVAQRLVDHAVARGSRDDTSVVLVDLRVQS